MMQLIPVVGVLPDGIEALESEARVEAVANVSRLITDWTSGAERFSKPGELLLAAYEDERLIGVGGLTLEPDVRLQAMRLRRLYVCKCDRRRGVGRSLAGSLIERGLRHSAILTLNAGVAGAGTFWEALGFRRVDGKQHTHELRRTG
jgi:GNAT superfamily N-acetyltransferase